MGTPQFSVQVLERLISDGYTIAAVVTQPDRPVGRKRTITPPPIKTIALQYDIPVLQPEKIRKPVEVEKVLAYKPDLIVTAAFGQILPKELLEAPPLGCINVHASLLPELRGGAPIHYAIMQGKKKTGVTIMYMVEKLDAGDMLAKVEVDIDETDHTGSMHDKLSKAGSDLVSETIPKLIDKTITPVSQNEADATFASNIKREQERIDWRKSGEEIYNQIRGLHPWPIAYTDLNGETVKIWWGEKMAYSNRGATPGEIIELAPDGIIVQTGNETAIKLTEVQPAGKKKMKAEQLLRGNHLFTVGTKLGE